MKSISTGPLIGRKTRVVLALAARWRLASFSLLVRYRINQRETGRNDEGQLGKAGFNGQLGNAGKARLAAGAAANGSVVAQQEAVIGPEISNYR
ncbi:MAG: hypothetical protein IPP59_04280, partial [Betaproteobacteria bacterium]|nr:hypothetical protein [Candidatus Dechloromonas phosphorivorans]